MGLVMLKTSSFFGGIAVYFLGVCCGAAFFDLIMGLSFLALVLPAVVLAYVFHLRMHRKGGQLHRQTEAAIDAFLRLVPPDRLHSDDANAVLSQLGRLTRYSDRLMG